MPPADPDRILDPRTAALLILVGGAALCATIILMVIIDPADRVVTRPSSYSPSAVGHAALASLLRESGYRVDVNRSRQGRGVAAEDLLLVLEPDLGTDAVADMQRLLAGKRRVLVALPKWRQRRTGMSPALPRGWIDGAALVSEASVDKVAHGVLGQATITRPGSDIAWTGPLGPLPEIETPQLVRDSNLRPLVASSDGGILVGEVPVAGADSRTLLLADPDLVANHGLHRGDNARLALGVIEQLVTSADATIHFDESLHGFAIVPSLPRLLLAPPFLAATLLALATIAVLVWGAAVRFGTARSGTEGTPVFGSGHETLLRNAGRLLAAARHAAYIADRYGNATLEEAARRLHVDPQGPANRDLGELRRTLEGIARRRGVRTRLPDTETLRPLARARRYYDWMEEMLGGYRAGRDSR